LFDVICQFEKLGLDAFQAGNGLMVGD